MKGVTEKYAATAAGTTTEILEIVNYFIRLLSRSLSIVVQSHIGGLRRAQICCPLVIVTCITGLFKRY